MWTEEYLCASLLDAKHVRSAYDALVRTLRSMDVKWVMLTRHRHTDTHVSRSMP
jgi:hypothetical protein